ncbi:MAG: hypothetical protein MPN21_12670 [Thermoanaerobaculia bacterium]|nr:hypothetical protein [Thermoanaerobaculia bacterium]
MRPTVHLPRDEPDFFTRLTPWLVAACLTAGMGWLVQSAGDGHVHVTAKGVERHHHGHLGEHTHDAAGGHVHEYAGDEKQDTEDDPYGSENQIGFFSAVWVAQSAPALPTGLPVLAVVAASALPPAFAPPTRDAAAQVQPRGPPGQRVSEPGSRAV